MSTCPTCSKPATADFAPFCSERCRHIDLNRWFTGAYAVPAVELDDVDFEEAESATTPPKSDDFNA
ncbi:MAG: hypothetical protein B7X02_01155 [Rhodospirillales bacterium 12-54-5]|nr:MAG: hypothetical protein B7X02_01155 [Rhodospirillales bacterium 12-54-5]